VPEVQSILETVFEVQNKDDPVLATAIHEKFLSKTSSIKTLSMNLKRKRN
jgi:hypothetical protein